MRAVLALLAVPLAACAGTLDGDPFLTLTEAAPATLSARGGETLVLRGTGFTEGAVVHLGDLELSDVELVSGEELRLVTPPLFAGPAPVTVTSRDGHDAALPAPIAVRPLDLRFVEAPPYALTTAGPQSAAVSGDFDGDGDLDLITAVAQGPCRFFANDGRGNFTGPDLDPMNETPDPRFPADPQDVRALAAADLDADGDLDLILGTAGDAPDLVYENDGQAVFTAIDALPADADTTTAIAIADLDSNGTLDIVAANTTADDAPLRIYLNSGALEFDAAPEGTFPAHDWLTTAIAIADLDRDGDLDLLLATADGALRLLRADAGAFHEPPGAPLLSNTPLTALAVADLDSDGAPDLVAAGPGQDRLLFNDGAGHFFDATATAMPLDASPAASLALVDLDRDRLPDLLIGNQGAQSRLYLNTGSGFVDHTPLLPIRSDDTVWITAADLDSDADQDLVLVNAAAPARLYLSVEPPKEPSNASP